MTKLTINRPFEKPYVSIPNSTSLRAQGLASWAFLMGMMSICSACKGPVSSGKAAASSPASQLGQKVSALAPSILSIYQDEQQHYWFGSQGQGLFYYNGQDLIRFTQADGLVHHQIRGIQGDQTGHIYLDTPAGVSKFDGNSFTTLSPVYSDQHAWTSAPDDLWFKGNGDKNGVFRYDGTSLFHLPFPEQDLAAAFGHELEAGPFSPYGVYGIYKDQLGHLWFGTLAAGVYRYDGDSLSWIGEKELTMLDDGRVPGIRSIIEDQDGHFWFSHILHRYAIQPQEGGGIHYEKRVGIPPSAADPPINLPYFLSAIRDSREGDLWMLSYSEGLWRYDGTQLRQYSPQDREKALMLYTLYQDQQGSIWLGTDQAGVYRFDGERFRKFSP